MCGYLFENEINLWLENERSKCNEVGCYISISNSKDFHHRGIGFNGGINQCLDYNRVCPLSCIEKTMSDIVVDIAS